jgi:hypothetical protein
MMNVLDVLGKWCCATCSARPHNPRLNRTRHAAFPYEIKGLDLP